MNRNEAWLDYFPEHGGGPCKRHGWGGGAVDEDGAIQDGLCPSCARYAYNAGEVERARRSPPSSARTMEILESLDMAEIIRLIVAPVMPEDVQVLTNIEYTIQIPNPINKISLDLVVDPEEEDDGKG